MISELLTTGCLGLALGGAVGFLGYWASGFDAWFGAVVGLAEFMGVLFSGAVGVWAAHVVASNLALQSWKWTGQLVTALQDLVGSFILITLCVQLLGWLSPGQVEGADYCM